MRKSKRQLEDEMIWYQYLENKVNLVPEEYDSIKISHPAIEEKILPREKVMDYCKSNVTPVGWMWINVEGVVAKG